MLWLLALVHVHYISRFLFALVGTSAIAAGVSTALTSAAAITTIFGVGGAGVYSLICTLFHHNDLVTT